MKEKLKELIEEAEHNLKMFDREKSVFTSEAILARYDGKIYRELFWRDKLTELYNSLEKKVNN